MQTARPSHTKSALEISARTRSNDSALIWTSQHQASCVGSYAHPAEHRASALPAPTTVESPRCAGTEASLSCETDSDCRDRPNGACISGDWVEGGTYCGCVYACGSDADCGSGEVCVPDGVVEGDFRWSTCRSASCTVDSECSSGECGISSWHDGCSYVVSQSCRDEAADSCRTIDDCPDGSSGCGTDWSATEAFTCHEMECAIGRPLRVEEGNRTAPTQAGGGWARSVARQDQALSADLRHRLAQRWAEIAALEHASVASFARFTLQLMALGAPADLLADTQRAAADEVEHARLAYGLASRFAGAPMRPGPLDLRGAMPAFDAESVMIGLVDEACVGETLGAAEAAEAARLCEDEDTRLILEQVAEDEARHAALAWRSLHWLLDQHPSLRPLARERLHATLAAHLQAGPELGLSAHGLLSGPALLALRQAAARDVLAPCVAALLPA